MSARSSHPGGLCISPGSTSPGWSLARGGRGLWCGNLVLAATVALLAPLLVPSHWTAIWMDRDFTGTVAPLANRLDPGVRLYTDGTHTPMSPLPIVFLHLLTGGQATWLWESALNFAFQALTLLLSHFALRRLFRPPVPFLATFVAIPLFFALQKTVLFEAMAQATTAALLLQITFVLSPREATVRDASRRTWFVRQLLLFGPLLALALTSAVALLVKQSTGIGACLGVAAALLVCDPRELRNRLFRTALWAFLSGCFLVVLIAALLPWVDALGLVRDVFLTGSEPKGGPGQLLTDLGRFFLSIAKRALVLAVPVGAVIALLRARQSPADERGALIPDQRPPTSGVVVTGAAIAAAATTAGMVSWRPLPPSALAVIEVLGFTVWFGLFLAALFAARRWHPSLLSERDAGPQPARLAGALAVTVAAALFHSLSARSFRWSYDNNPLVLIALAGLFQATLAVLDRLRSRRVRLAAFSLVCLIAIPLPAWTRLADQIVACRQCTESWPEVRHLAGARMRPSASGVRRAVAEVRTLAAPGQEVLLLPEDPDVGEWFERPRPRVSSLMIFVDQYWDRDVDSDLARLLANPPQVIVLGPTATWRRFSHHYQHRRGAERLIDCVMEQLLAHSYELRATIPILRGGQEDSLEIYTLRR